MSGTEQNQGIDGLNLSVVASIHGQPKGENIEVFHNRFASRGVGDHGEFCFLLTHGVEWFIRRSGFH
jgi:hypothetical protein